MKFVYEGEIAKCCQVLQRRFEYYDTDEETKEILEAMARVDASDQEGAILDRPRQDRSRSVLENLHVQGLLA